MQKDYEIKLYTLAGVLIKTIERSLIKSEIAFSSSINSWPGEIKILLNVPFSYSGVSANNVIRVYEFDEDSPSTWRNIYTGVIQRVTRSMRGGMETVELSALWIHVLLTHLYFYNAGYTFTVTDEPKNIIEDIIDYVNSIYTGSWLTYDGASLDTYGSNISLDIAYTKCNDVLKDIVKSTNYYFVFDGTGKLFFREKPTTATLSLTFEKDIDEITLEEDYEKIINKYILTYKTATLAPVIDATSQTANGLRELYEQRTQIADATTAWDYASSYIADGKNYKKKTRIVVNSGVVLEDILPGIATKVLNISYPIDDVIIQKVSYTSKKCTLEVDTIKNFILELNS